MKAKKLTLAMILGSAFLAQPALADDPSPLFFTSVQKPVLTEAVAGSLQALGISHASVDEIFFRMDEGRPETLLGWATLKDRPGSLLFRFNPNGSVRQVVTQGPIEVSSLEVSHAR